MKKNTKRVVIAVIVVIVLAGAGGGYYWYRQEKAAEDIAALYETATAAIGTVGQTVTAEGNADAYDEIDLYTDTTQTVANVNVKVGDAVSPAEELITYDVEKDAKELKRQLSQAQLNLDNAKLAVEAAEQPAEGSELLQYQSGAYVAGQNVKDAQTQIDSVNSQISQVTLQLNDAKNTLDRTTELYNNGAATKADFDKAQLARDTYQEQLENLNVQKEAAQRQLETTQQLKSDADEELYNAQHRLDTTTAQINYDVQQNNVQLAEISMEQIQDAYDKLKPSTVSPVKGSVEAVNVSAGGMAGQGAPVITILDLSQIVVKSDVSEYDAPLLKIGQVADVTTSGLPDKVYTGHISKIAAAAVEKSDSSSDDERVVPVEITIDNADDQFKAGYTVDIVFHTLDIPNVLNVPSQAVQTDPADGKNYVYKVENNALAKTEVQLGTYGDTTVQITGGIAEGDVVVLNAASVQDGTEGKKSVSILG